MSADEFSFILHVSRDGYTTKPAKKLISRITFEPRKLTIDDALKCVTEGRAFCYTFSTASKDGIITLKDKTEANFLSTSTVIYDFDDMDVPMHDYIETLPFKPSFAYPTYSDGKNGYRRFRLVYVFEQPLSGVSAFNALYEAIAAANSFVPENRGQHGGWDRRGVSQLYFGTTAQASTYNGHIVYSISDFEQFAVVRTDAQPATTLNASTWPKYESVIDPRFLYDFMHISQEALFTKYKEQYFPNYAPSLSTPLMLDESGMFYTYPDDFVCVYHKRKGKYTLRWGIGEDRKKKMFITAQVMLYNLPGLSIENLLYNLRLERQWYYDNSDGKVDNAVLLQTAVNALEKPYLLEPSTHGAFKLNKEYWAGQGKTANEAKMIVRRLLRAREVDRLYDPELTISENYRMLKEQGVRISLRTLERMVTRGDIKIVTPHPHHTYLSCCRDADTIRILKLIDRNERITQSEIAEALNYTPRTIKRYMDAMRGVYIEREGNNRSGRWVIIHPFPWEHSDVDSPADKDKDNTGETPPRPDGPAYPVRILDPLYCTGPTPNMRFSRS